MASEPPRRPTMLTTRTHSHKPAHMIALSLCAAVLVAIVSAGCGATRTSPPTPEKVTVTLMSPTIGSRTAADHVTVRGTVTPADAVVEIQGQPAAVGNGVFTGTATLHHGPERSTSSAVRPAQRLQPPASQSPARRPTLNTTRHTPWWSTRSAASSTWPASRSRARATETAATGSQWDRTRPARSPRPAPPTRSPVREP